MATSAQTITTAYAPLSTTPSLVVMNATLARNLQQFQQGQKRKRPSLTLKLRFNLGPSEEEKASEDTRSRETTESDRDTDSAEETQSVRDLEDTEDEKPEEEARPSKRQRKSPEERKGKAKQAPAKSPPSRAPAKRAKTRGASANTKSPPELPDQTLHLRLFSETQSPALRLRFRPLRPRTAPVQAGPTLAPTPTPTPAPKPAPAASKPQKQQQKKVSPPSSQHQKKSPKQSTYALRSALPVPTRIPSPHTLPTQPLHENPEEWLPVDKCPAPLHALAPHGPREAWARLFPNELPLGEYGGEPTGWMARMMWKGGAWVERGPGDKYEKRMLGPELAKGARRDLVRELVRELVDWEEVARLGGLMGIRRASEEGEGEAGSVSLTA